MFEGFTPETIDFLWELRMDNSRRFMEQNRERYQQVLKIPFDCLTADLVGRMEQVGKGLSKTYNISRINRDIRFSKDNAACNEFIWICRI